MKDTDKMPFGKHKGDAMINVPAGYLIWLHDEASIGVRNAFPQVFRYTKENLDMLMEEHDKKE